jgi:uncharacterized membrane protein YkvA (DUF1232 family)
MSLIEGWKRRARQLKTEIYALYLAYRDPRVPWYARIFAACVVGYAFSPIDLIPDPIPVLGYVDDLILIPLGVALAIKMIPPDVLADSRARAKVIMAGEGRPVNRAAGVVIVALWMVLAVLALAFTLQFVGAWRIQGSCPVSAQVWA